MNNLSDFANFGELQIVLGGVKGALWGAPGRGAPNGSLRPGRQKPSLRLCVKVSDANEFYNDFLLTTFVAFIQASSKLLNKLS